MSKGGSTNTTTTQTKLPEYIDNAAKATLQFGGQVANRPYQAYSGPGIASLSPDQLAAWANVRGMGDPGIGAAQTSAMGFSNFNAPKVSTNVNDYMNPYTSNVIDTTMSDMDRSRQLAIQGNDDAAIKSGAFGGDRQAVTNAITNSESQRNMGQMAAQLRSQGFTDASGKAFAADQGNQDSAIRSAGVGLSADQMVGQLGSAEQSAALQRAAALEQAGAGQQSNNQNNINYDISKFNNAWNYPQDQLNTLIKSLGGTPYGSSSSTTSPSTAASPITGALGGAAAGAGLYSTLGLAAPWALPFAIGGGLLGAFS